MQLPSLMEISTQLSINHEYSFQIKHFIFRKANSESINKIIFLKCCQNKLMITIRHTQAACLWTIIKHKYSQMGWNNIYINCWCFFIIDQIRASWRIAPYAHTTIPLVDYSHIDGHCKANVQARICVDLNSVTTHQISESSLLLKNKFTSKLGKNLLATSIMKPTISFLVSLLT